MEPITIGYIAIGVLIILLFSGLHIGVVMGLIGFVGMIILNGWEGGLGVMKTTTYTTWANYDFSVIPLFVLMGEFCFHGDISGDLYSAAHKFLGSLRGGLAMATIGACAAFAAVSGSSMATAATMATVALPEMRKHNYNPSLATGTLAAGGTIGLNSSQRHYGSLRYDYPAVHRPTLLSRIRTRHTSSPYVYWGNWLYLLEKPNVGSGRRVIHFYRKNKVFEEHLDCNLTLPPGDRRDLLRRLQPYRRSRHWSHGSFYLCSSQKEIGLETI